MLPTPAEAKADGRCGYAPPTFDGDAAQFPFHFLPYASAAFLDGSLAHLPWLQEMPDPMTSAMWSSWVEINPKTAERLGIALGDIVEVASTVGALRRRRSSIPGSRPTSSRCRSDRDMRPTRATRRAAAQNPVEILAPVAHADTGALAWAATRVKVSRVGEPDGKLVLFSARGELRENPHEGETR